MTAKGFLGLALALSAMFGLSSCDKHSGSSSACDSSSLQSDSLMTDNSPVQDSSRVTIETANAVFDEGIAFAEKVISEETSNAANEDIAELTRAQPEVHSPDAGSQIMSYKAGVELFGESFGAAELEEGERGGDVISLSFLANAREGAGYEGRLSSEECEKIYTSLLGKLSALYGEPQKYDDGLFKGAYFTDTHIKNTKRVIIKYCDKYSGAGSFVNTVLCFEKRQGLK